MCILELEINMDLQYDNWLFCIYRKKYMWQKRTYSLSTFLTLRAHNFLSIYIIVYAGEFFTPKTSSIVKYLVNFKKIHFSLLKSNFTIRKTISPFCQTGSHINIAATLLLQVWSRFEYIMLLNLPIILSINSFFILFIIPIVILFHSPHRSTIKLLITVHNAHSITLYSLTSLKTVLYIYKLIAVASP